MQPYVLDWLNLLLRWAHVVVGIAWIGASFYFVFLDNSLRQPKDPESRAKGVSGELWAVHGGGFYHPQKYLLAPPHLPTHLHWFYWESYATWLTGFALFTLIYLWRAPTFLIDQRVHAWPTWAAISVALAMLAGFWLIYDLVCRTLGRGPHGERWVGAVLSAVVVLAAWLACHWFATRAAFLLVGAMMATAMSANVLVWIIPGQRTVLAQMRAGEAVDPDLGRRAKQRSVHNTYFTLPVLVAMLSNHYGFLQRTEHAWLVLVLLMGAGALIRHFFVARHQARVQGRQPPWAVLLVGVALLAALMVGLRPEGAADTSAVPPSFAQVQQIVSSRCQACHNAMLSSKNVRLDSPELILQQAAQIHQQAVVLQTMPINNATQITPAERGLLGRWFAAGAPGPSGHAP